MPNIPKFVYALHDIQAPDGIIHQFEVGIVDSENQQESLVNFVVKNRKITVSNSDIQAFNPLETGDLYPKKICNVCHKYLDVNQFSKNQNGKDNRTIRRPSCNECRKVIDGTPLKRSEAKKWNKEKPDMAIFECPICHKTTIAGLTSKVVLDHDHDTGMGRGWICDSCNTGIGRFKDDIKLLVNAIKYLRPNLDDLHLPDE